MSTVIETLERAQLRRVPAFHAGDRVRVHFQVIEGTRRRTQVFEGVVIKRQGHGVRETFTVRKQSFGVGVERTFPVHSPKIEKIEVAARGDVRRAKLYYLRDRVGKRARVRERRSIGPEEVVERELLHEPGASRTSAARPPRSPSERRRGRGCAADRRPRPPRRRRRARRPRRAEAAGDAADGPRPRPRPTSAATTVRTKPKSGAGSLLELVVIVAVALGLALGIQAFLVKPYRIPSGSMVPTLAVGQRVLVNRIGNHFGDPKVGDIVVFHPPQGADVNDVRRCRPGPSRRARRAAALRAPTPTRSEQNFIKRVVGRSRRHASRSATATSILNGKRQKEPFIQRLRRRRRLQPPRTITVPAGHYFMMGDNRGESDDSRFWGPSRATGSSAAPSPPTGRPSASALL